MSLLDPGAAKSAIEMAEHIAIDQIKSYLSGRYNVEAIFSATGEERNHFILMITIDIALYHLWSKQAPRKIPELRARTPTSRQDSGFNALAKLQHFF